MGVQLFAHNQEAYEATVKLLAETGKAAIVHPTGTGKSFIGFQLCADHPNKRICWLSPSEYIFKTQIGNLSAAADGYAPNNIRFFTYAKPMALSETELEELQSDYIVLDEFHVMSTYSYQQQLEQYQKRVKRAKSKAVRDTAEQTLDALRCALEHRSGVLKHMTGCNMYICGSIRLIGIGDDLMYKYFFKRMLDLIFSTLGIVVLIPIWLLLAFAIKIDDPGPVFFKQKRIAKDKNGSVKLFKIYKYRSMKMKTPHDIPTHLLENPEQYITRIGSILRKTSLDELPQIFNIWLGQMSIIGPRPALWNQKDLYIERAKYGANGIKPGLTGWAQINGRDELEIDVKAKLDGEYVQKMSFLFDCKCFLGTIFSVLKRDGVVEGGTGELLKETNEGIKP